VHFRATQHFLEAVSRLPGVLRAEVVAGSPSGEPACQGYLRPGDEGAEEAVYAEKGRVYELFPDARLDVWVLDAVQG
jgi:hypothetical protein